MMSLLHQLMDAYHRGDEVAALSYLDEAISLLKEQKPVADPTAEEVAQETLLFLVKGSKN